MLARLSETRLIDEGHESGVDTDDGLDVMLYQTPKEPIGNGVQTVGQNQQPTGPHGLQLGHEDVEIPLFVVVVVREPMEPYAGVSLGPGVV